MPRATTGDVERLDPRTQPRFVRMPIPPKSGCKQTGVHGTAIRSLTIGGDAYVVPINGGDPKAAAARIRSYVSAATKSTGLKYCVRATEIDGAPVIAVWCV